MEHLSVLSVLDPKTSPIKAWVDPEKYAGKGPNVTA
jgi:hypothetical protein